MMINFILCVNLIELKGTEIDSFRMCFQVRLLSEIWVTGPSGAKPSSYGG